MRRFQKLCLSMIASLIVIVTLFCSTAEGHETDMRKELFLTYKEKVAFDKFKTQVWRNVSKAPGFIKTDLFLLRWIRAKNLNVNLAVRDMFECLEWRKVNKLDTIQSEDWSDMLESYPYTLNTVDLQGRPVGMGSIGGDWNVRRGILQGKLKRMTRYTYKLVEDAFQHLYEINHKHPNVTQFSVIANLEGFNVFQQACPVCLSLYVQLLTTYNRYYPNFAHAIIAINTPQAFKVVLDLVKPMLNKETNEALQIFGYNKNKWKPVLDNEVSEDKRTAEFGGTLPDDEDR